MAIDACMWFQDAEGLFLDSESQVDVSRIGHSAEVSFPPSNNIFLIEAYSLDIAQVLNIGSDASGAGAGKVAFDPLVVTRKSDRASPILFQMACAGKTFQFVTLVLKKSSGGAVASIVTQRFTFKLVGIKSIAWASDTENPNDVVTFEYGGLVIEYWLQNLDGSLGAKVLGGWDRVKNIADHDPASALI